MTNCDLANNPNTPQETLKFLVTDKDWDIRWEVANNPNTPQETLKLLATDKDWDIRWEVANNPNASEEIKLKVKSYNKFENLIVK